MAGTNDIVIKIATVNGTGSASANGLLRKAIFRMGVPVVGKNYFPSNIQGLPTWYEIRVTKDGYQSRSDRVDIMVAMNVQTYEKDLAEVSPGGFLVYDSTWPRERTLNRDDITVLGVPLSKMCNENFSVARVRILMKNVAYVGVLSALLGSVPSHSKAPAGKFTNERHGAPLCRRQSPQWQITQRSAGALAR